MKKRIGLNTIYNKLLLICLILLIVPSLIIGYESYKTAKQELDEKGKIILKNSVNQVIQLIDTKQQEVTRGNLAVAQAQEEIKEFVLGKKASDGTRPINKEIDLGDNGYIYIMDDKGNEIAHPSLEGESLWEHRDKSGKDFYFAQDQIQKGKNGGGFTEYSWELPQSTKIAPKITYSAYEEHWGWVVVAGTYKMDFNEGAKTILNVLLLTLIPSLIIGIIIILLFARHISGPIRKIGESLERVAEGDLSLEEITVKNNDETGLLAISSNKMIKNLRELLNTVKESTNTVLDASSSLSEISSQTASATDEVALAISEIANSSTEQARDVESGAIQINDLSREIEHITEISKEMNNVSSKTNDLAKSGLGVVEVLTGKSLESNEATRKVNDVIIKVNDSTKQIGTITNAISEIAEQTNLLALNASIEAARAGEAGRGFAVVADEIRKLAEQSAKSVKDINEILQGIQNNSEVAVSSIEITRDIVDEQNEVVERTTRIFDDISNSILELIEKVSNVNNSSIDMNSKKEEIIAMVENLSAISEETAASTQEVSASTEEQLAAIQEVANHAKSLTDLSNNLLLIVEKFNV